MKPPTRLASAHAHLAIASQLPRAISLRRRAQADGFRVGPLSDGTGTDTLFVIGTGPSICALGKDRWEHVKIHDSLGINFFGLHQFVPTWLSQENLGEGANQQENQSRRVKMLGSYGDEHPVEIWRLLPQNRSQLAADRGFLDAPHRTGGTAHALIGVILAVHEEVALQRVVAGMNSRGRGLRAMYDHGVSIALRSSAVWAVWLARHAGYARVVLCGIDLLGKDNFWDHDPGLLREGLTGRPNNPTRDGVVYPAEWHPAERGVPSTSAAILALKAAFDDGGGPEIYLGTRGSRLSGRVPDYAWA